MPWPRKVRARPRARPMVDEASLATKCELGGILREGPLKRKFVNAKALDKANVKGTKGWGGGGSSVWCVLLHSGRLLWYGDEKDLHKPPDGETNLYGYEWLDAPAVEGGLALVQKAPVLEAIGVGEADMDEKTKKGLTKVHNDEKVLVLSPSDKKDPDGFLDTWRGLLDTSRKAATPHFTGACPVPCPAPAHPPATASHLPSDGRCLIPAPTADLDFTTVVVRPEAGVGLDVLFGPDARVAGFKCAGCPPPAAPRARAARTCRRASRDRCA